MRSRLKNYRVFLLRFVGKGDMFFNIFFVKELVFRFFFRYSFMKFCWRWSEDSRFLFRELDLRFEIVVRIVDDKVVL